MQPVKHLGGAALQDADPLSIGSSRLKAAQRAPRRQDCLPHL